MERRFFVSVKGFERLRFVEYREDGCRFAHQKDGTITEFEGDGRLDSPGKNGEHISHTLSVIEDRLKCGVWRELPFTEAFPDATPKTLCEEIW